MIWTEVNPRSQLQILTWKRRGLLYNSPPPRYVTVHNCIHTGGAKYKTHNRTTAPTKRWIGVCGGGGVGVVGFGWNRATGSNGMECRDRETVGSLCYTSKVSALVCVWVCHRGSPSSRLCLGRELGWHRRHHQYILAKMEYEWLFTHASTHIHSHPTYT